MYWICLIATYLLVGTEAQKSVPAWLADELQWLKKDSETQVKTAQFVLSRIENAIIRSRRVYPPLPVTPRSPVPIRGRPRNCKEALGYRSGYLNEWRVIDPDGVGGVPPLRVKCQRKGNSVISKFGFAADYWTRKYNGPQNCIDRSEFGVPGLEDYCSETKTEINYDFSKQQMRSAIHVSGKCTQRVTWDCASNSLLYLKGLSSKMMAFGRSLNGFSYFTQGECECAKNDRCILPRTRCNCAADPTKTWERDEIVIRDSRSLPVTEVLLGDLKRPQDRAQVFIYNVECED